MPNPYLILGAVVLWLASLTGVYVKATEWQRNADTAAAAKDLKQKLDQAEQDWQTNYAAALEVEQEKQANERKHQTHSRAVAVAVASDPKAAGCGLSPDSLSVLIDSIRSANGAQDAAASVGDGGLQPGSGTTGPVAGSSGVGAGQHGVDAIRVPTGAQGTARVGN